MDSNVSQKGSIMSKLFILVTLFMAMSLSMFGIFTDVTQQTLGNLPAAVPGSGSLAFPDINSDGWADFFVSPYHFYINNHDGTFTYRDPADLIAAGVPNTLHRPAFADADNDGDLDMVLSVYYGNQAHYLENSGAPGYQFTGSVLYTHPTNVLGGQPSFVDGDNDGLPEIYLSMFGNWAPNYAIGWDQYFKYSLQSHLWSNQTVLHFPQLTQPLYRRPARGSAAADFDKDGDMDIFIPNYGISYSENWEDILWQNDGNGNFTDVATAMNVNIEPHCRYGIGLGSGASWGDYDNDGDFDIAISNIHGWAAIYTNNFPLPFSNDTAACGLITTGGEKQWHNTLWADIDNDNDQDLLLTQWYEGYQSYIFRNDGPENLGHFTDVTAELGFNPTGNMNYCEGFVAGDYDHDGDMDISFYSNQAPTNGTWFYRNDQNTGNHWLVTTLQGNGTTTTKTALGSTIKIYYKDGKVSPLKQVESTSGDMVMNMIPVHFGMAGYDTFQEIRVDWLNGDTEYFYPEDFDNHVNQYVTITQGSGHVLSRMVFVDQNFTGTTDGSETRPFTTIQPAINLAQNSYLIIVKDGMYFENLNIQNKAVTLVNAHGPEACMLSGSGSGSVITIAGNPTLIPAISGMLITEGSSANGAGINLQNSGLILNNVKFTTNSATQAGGAVSLTNASLIANNCDFDGNFALHGGAISANNSQITLHSCVFTANGGNTGAAIGSVGYLTANSSLEMVSCLLNHNLNTTGNCAGIYSENSDISIYNSTIADNSSATGAAIQATNSDVTLKNTIVWHNQPASYSGTGNQLSLVNSDIDANLTGSGVIRVEPAFVNRTARDYHLSDFSACLGTGIVTADVGSSLVDLEGNARPLPAGSNPDMGCYENSRGAAAPLHLRVATTGSDVTGNGSESNPFATIQHALNVSIGGDTIVVNAGTYHESLTFNGKSTAVQSNFVYSGNPADIANTIIDGGDNARCISFNLYETKAACLNGFTLQHGSADRGGAILLDHASPTLKNLHISDCTVTDRGGAIFAQYSSPLLKGITMHANTAGNRGGAILLLNSPARIERCVFYGNSSVNQGGAFAAYMSDPQIFNSTFYNNTVAQTSTGGAIYGYSADVLMVNSIFWNNTATQFTFTTSNPVWAYCDVQSGTDGVGNINLDPLFTNTSANDFSLQTASPCVNSGIASYAVADTVIYQLLPAQYNGTAPDMGAWEYGFNLPVEDESAQVITRLLPNYPNPFNKSTQINLTLSKDSDISVKIFNVKGQLVRQLSATKLKAGNHQLRWDAKDDTGKEVSGGIYVCTLKSAGKSQAIKMLLLK